MSTAEKQAATTHSRTRAGSWASVRRQPASPARRAATFHPVAAGRGATSSAGSSSSAGTKAAAAKNTAVMPKIFGKPSTSASHGPSRANAATIASRLPITTLTTIARPRCPAAINLPWRAAAASWVRPLAEEKTA